ncbi:uncharacterized protein LOC103791246 isoform X4 [Callithrix jacchus]
MKLNLDYLLEMLWEYLVLTCIYTRKRTIMRRQCGSSCVVDALPISPCREAGLHRRHHPLERGLSGAHVPLHPPVTRQRVQVCPGVGHQHQVQSTAGGSDPHHGA